MGEVGESWTALGAEFFARPAPVVAPELLNRLLVVHPPAGLCVGRIVEVEAYTPDDPASHSYRGRTAANAVMFGPPGGLYVYRSYGIHWCANVVCGDVGEGAAVLLRALAPYAGLASMAARRGRSAPRDLCSGPGKLTQAVGIDGTHNGADVNDPGSVVRVVADGVEPPGEPVVARRIGLSVGVDTLWRWYVAGDPNVSRR